MAFTAEATNSGGSSFATFVVTTPPGGGSSAHIPLSALVWGADSANLVVTDTADPFPVQLPGIVRANHEAGSSAHNGLPVIGWRSNDTVAAGDYGFLRITEDRRLIVSGTDTANNLLNVAYSSAAGGYDATNSALRVNVVSASQSSVTVASGTITVGNDTTDPVGVNQVGYVAPSTTVTITNANDTTVTVAALSTTSIVRVQNDSGTGRFYVQADSNNPVFTRDENSTTVTVTSGTITVGNDTTDPVGVDQIGYVAPSTTVTVSNTVTVEPTSSAALRINPASSAGGLQTFATVLSSAIETVTSSAARLYGWHIYNPDTAADAYVKMFADDSTGVTKGTTAAIQNIAVPFGGGNNVAPSGAGIVMSSGISLLAAGGTALTDTSAPSTSMVVTVWYKDVSG